MDLKAGSITDVIGLTQNFQHAMTPGGKECMAPKANLAI
jgi:hypothetical protein